MADACSLLNLYSVNPPDNAYPKAKANVLRALEIDPNLAEAHATFAYIKFFHERDRAGSELEFRRAIQVNPSYAQAHHWFALTLAARGERVDAVTEIETAKRLDPRSAAIRSAAGVVHFQTGEYLKAIEESNAALAIDERAVPAYKVKRWAYTTMGDRRNAEEAFRSEVGFEIALAYNALGNIEKALDWLQRSEAAGGHSFNFLQVEPRLANLRNETRYAALANKLK